MRVIACASAKGGVGKTTVACSLAVAAECAGAGPVVLLDFDPQQSLAKWWNRRKSDVPQLGQIDIDTMDAGLAFLAKQGYQTCIIDTPPSVVSDIARVIAASDLVLIPARPSPVDLEAITSTIDMVEAAGKPMLFLINGAANRARITLEAARELSQHGLLAPTTMMQRTDFAACMISGQTVIEIDPTGKSAGEITELWKYVSLRLKKLPIRRAKVVAAA